MSHQELQSQSPSAAAEPQAATATSSIGTHIIATGGLVPGTITYNGGHGGSGGGSCGGALGSSSAAGGSGGSNGLRMYTGGTGQGSSHWSSAVVFLNLTSLQITFGSGGGAINNTNSSNCPGGGGGGGIMINGIGPQASNGTAPGGQGGIGGYGYGAGSGAGGFFNLLGFSGAKGAAGDCIIKWY